MSALARYFKSLGKSVSGYDKTSTSLTRKLMEEGIDIHYNDSVKMLPANVDLVIYTPAIPNGLNLFQHLKKLNIPIKKRSEILGQVTHSKKSVAVAGTHGKTTVSSLIAHMLNNSKVGCNAFLGGIAKNYNSNLILNDNSEYMVVEADEYDKSFLQLSPFYTLITAMDADHLDIYDNFEKLKKTFLQFIAKTSPGGKLLISKSIENKLQTKDHSVTTFTYSLNDNKADFYAANIRLSTGLYFFDIFTPFGEIKNLQHGMPGLINVENAVAATAMSKIIGLDNSEIRDSLKSFIGIHRRFDYQVNSRNLVYIDDYAHHPEEVDRFVTSVRELYPGKKILGIFQPHLYSRTRDFATEFAKSLSLLDEIILLPVYPARELPIPGVGSKMISDKMEADKTSLADKTNLIEVIDSKTFDVILTIGAGDINKLAGPLKNHLENKYILAQ
ncbi:MAG: UDP-N-acetylmuramate--L-alanine ligase [Bacteroidales bacterium]|nr:UDP-N-acetylmuramate--L-alanine ligase [Bacteroidales bacterium]